MAGTYLEIGGGSGGGGGSGIAPVQHAVANAAALPLVGDEDGQLIYVIDTESIYAWDAVGTVWDHILNGLADVSGPVGATDNRVVRMDGATGKLIQESVVSLSDTGSFTGVENIGLSGTITTPLTTKRLTYSEAGVLTVAAAGTTDRMTRGDADGLPVPVANAQLDSSGNATFATIAATGVIKAAALSTIAIDAIGSPTDGMIAFDSTAGRFRGYSTALGGWVYLHGWGT